MKAVEKGEQKILRRSIGKRFLSKARTKYST